MMFKHTTGWDLNARMLRLFNDHHEAGMRNKSEHTRDAAIRIAEIVRTEISQDQNLVWC